MDIFLSYRRDGGESLAHLLYDRLTREGYTVFLDVESLRSGDFNRALYDRIDSCTDFLLLLPPHALDRCADPADWVRLEVERALAQKKNIVPVMMRGFEFPARLPDSLSSLPRLNGVRADMDLFDGVILRLKNHLLRSRAAQAESLFPVTQMRPDFPLWFKEYQFSLRLSSILGEPVSEAETRRAHSDFDSWAAYLAEVKTGASLLTPRRPLGSVQANGTSYTLYEIFLYNGAKYAYALQDGIPLHKAPRCAFFSVDSRDQLLQILPSSAQFRDLLLCYACCLRMLNYLPGSLLPTGQRAAEALAPSLTREMLNGVAPDLARRQLLHVYSKEFNPGLTIPFVSGHLPKTRRHPRLNARIDLDSADQQVFLLTEKPPYIFEGYRSLKLPTRNHLLVDLVTVVPESAWIALAYPLRDSRREHIRLAHDPVYFLLTRHLQPGEIPFGYDGQLLIETLDPDPSAPYLGDLRERFALTDILMQLGGLDFFGK